MRQEALEVFREMQEELKKIKLMKEFEERKKEREEIAKKLVKLRMEEDELRKKREEIARKEVEIRREQEAIEKEWELKVYINALKDAERPKEEVAERVVNKFSLSLEEAESKVEQYW